jgi:hypothetical protein
VRGPIDAPGGFSSLPPEERYLLESQAGQNLLHPVSDSDPIRLPKRALSTEETCDTTTTLCLGRFPSPTSSRISPGSFARCKCDVNAHTTTVVMREWLKMSSRTRHRG